VPHDADTPKKIGELIDRIEQIREELLGIQHALEKMEPVETSVPAIPATNS
jgi:hypothetical protein